MTTWIEEDVEQPQTTSISLSSMPHDAVSYNSFDMLDTIQGPVEISEMFENEYSGIKCHDCQLVISAEAMPGPS